MFLTPVCVFFCLTFLPTVSAVLCMGSCDCQAPTITCHLSRSSAIPILPTTIGYSILIIFGNQEVTNFPDDTFTSNWVLRTLEIHNTNISELHCIALDKIKNDLYTLRLIGNQFQEILRCLIGRLTALESLVITKSQLNFLSNGDFFSNSLLTEVDLSRNKLRGIHPQAMKAMGNLKKLIFRENQITELAIGQFDQLGNPSLDLLDLSYNQISTLSDNMLQGISSRLKKLDISYNRITSTTWPGTLQTLQTFSSLTEIVLSGNKIEKIHGESFNNTFVNLHGLQVAECSLVDIPWEYFQNIARLNVSGNAITQNKLNMFLSNTLCPSTVSSCPGVSLDISSNDFTDIRLTRDFDTNSKPLSISAKKNRLRNVFVFLNNVRSVYTSKRPQLNLRLSDNQISKPVQLFTNPLSSTRSYTYNQPVSLDLSYNRLNQLHSPPLRVYIAPLDNLTIAEEIPTEDLYTRKIDLFELDLSGNDIVAIPSESSLVAQVRILRLNRNRISSLGRLSLTNAPPGYNRLEILELRYNGLSNIDIDAFHGLSKLLKVDLRDNGLVSMPDLSPLAVLSGLSVMLDSNPLDCNCDLAWIASTASFYTRGRITGRCKAPARLEGYHPVCYDFGEDNCPRVRPSFNYLLWKKFDDTCVSDHFVGLRKFTVEAREAKSLKVSWTKFGPGSIFGYIITYEAVGEPRIQMKVHQDLFNFTLNELKPSVTYQICLTVALTDSFIQFVEGSTRCLNSTTMTAEVERQSAAVVGLSVTVSLLIAILVLTIIGVIRYLRNRPGVDPTPPQRSLSNQEIRENYEPGYITPKSEGGAIGIQDRLCKRSTHADNPYTSKTEMYEKPMSRPVDRPPKPPKPSRGPAYKDDQVVYEDLHYN